MLRALACSALIITGIASRGTALVLAALALNMVLDSADGAVARRYGRETVFGAQADGAVDRFLAMAVILTIAVFRGSAVAGAQALIVSAQFVLVDQVLCAQFLRFGLWSPDHFYVVDETVWRLNWSPLAKLLGNGPLLLFTVSAWTAWIAVPVAMLLIVSRVYSYSLVRVRARTLLPELGYAIGPDAPDQVDPVEVVVTRTTPTTEHQPHRPLERRRPQVNADVGDVAHA